MIPRSLLGPAADYQENLRRSLYPKLHTVLKPLGGYGKAKVYEDQYVGTLHVGEETVEKELWDMGFERNPIAAYKYHGSDNRKSTGSWRLLPENDPTGLVDDRKQVHVTLFRNEALPEYIDVYAHYEYNWESEAVKHLRSVDFNPSEGVELAETIFDQHSYLKLYNKVV
jgi:hypothetical protein